MANFYDDSPELASAYNLPEVYNSPDSPTLNSTQNHRTLERHTSQAQNQGQHQHQHQHQQPQQAWSPLHSNHSPLRPLPLSLPPPPPPPPKQPIVSIQQDELPYGSTRQRQTLDSSAPSALHHYSENPGSSGPPYPPGPRGNRRHGALLRGGSRLVLVLSILCAILGAAVVGLAAGTGVVAGRYADTSARLESLSSSYSLLESHARTAAPTATGGAQPVATSLSSMTNGCSDKDEKTTGTRFVSKFHERPSFTMFCNSDTQNGPLTAVFAGTFDTCMEACGSWNNYNDFNNFTSPNCNGVTFVPGWLNLTRATADRASGSCFLKAGLNRTTLVQPTLEMEVHSALLEDKVGSDPNSKRNAPLLVSSF
jgi:hypothetical protein